MCGISAVVELDASRAGSVRAQLATMHAQIPHRGPDGERFAALGFDGALHCADTIDDTFAATGAPKCGMAFRWLAIQDLDRSAMQPMGSADGRQWLLFNGEIYNFIELREELRALGATFRTDSDSEVILAAWRQWGEECVQRFDGMWALLLFDLDRRKLFGSRDRFGMKPLFYSIDGSRIVFASEVKQIVAASSVNRVGAHFMMQFLAGSRQNETNETFFDGIFSIDTATNFSLDLDASQPRMESRRYWSPRGALSAAALSLPEASAELERLLLRSVSLHARARVKVGSLLSGGLDSSLLTAMLARVSPEQRESFSIVFGRGEYARFDESPYIDAVAAKSGVRNHQTSFDVEELRRIVPLLTRAQDEPLIASTLVAQYRVFQLARENGVTVVLDGQGSDELFGGYATHEELVWRDRLRRGELASWWKQTRGIQRRYGSSLLRIIGRGLLGPAVRRLRPTRHDFIDRQWRERGRHSERLVMKSGGVSRLHELLEREVTSSSLPHLFLFSDHSAMAHSIEARLPYVDHRLAEFALQLPDAFKIGFGVTKLALREVARSWLPDTVVDRRDKMGFVTPERVWLRRELREEVAALATAPALAAAPFLRFEKVGTFVRDYLDGRHDDYRAIWRLWALRQFLELYSFES